jgi:hypothetical protein
MDSYERYYIYTNIVKWEYAWMNKCQ